MPRYDAVAQSVSMSQTAPSTHNSHLVPPKHILILNSIQQIHKAKAEKQRERVLKEEMDAKRAKTKAARERRQERVSAKRTALTGGDEEDGKKE